MVWLTRAYGLFCNGEGGERGEEMGDENEMEREEEKKKRRRREEESEEMEEAKEEAKVQAKVQAKQKIEGRFPPTRNRWPCCQRGPFIEGLPSSTNTESLSRASVEA